MTQPALLRDRYGDYIACLNRQDWGSLDRFVHEEVQHNGRPLGLPGYREMLVNDFREIADLYFDVERVVSDPPFVASRIVFACSPRARFLGLDVDGRKVCFSENVFYEYRDEKIWKVWSVIDKAAIEAQL